MEKVSSSSLDSVTPSLISFLSFVFPLLCLFFLSGCLFLSFMTAFRFFCWLPEFFREKGLILEIEIYRKHDGLGRATHV